MDCTRSGGKREAFVSEVMSQVEAIVDELYWWLREEERTLATMEEEVVGMMRRVGQAFLHAACEASTPKYPEPSVTCRCGAEAEYVCRREGKTKTQVDWIRLKRPYYLCGTCHRGHYPLDERLGFCAGGISAGLDGTLAYVGTLLPYEESSQLVERLLGVPISATRVRYSTERLGELVVREEDAAIAAAWDSRNPQLPTPVDNLVLLYISMDGVKVHTREEGWKEQRLGAVYTAAKDPPSSTDKEAAIRAQDISYHAAMGDVAHFGKGLWLEAQRRGLTQAQLVVVIGDGAQWIWNIAQEHFPSAIQILDWYHVTEYVWNAAKAIYGQEDPLGRRWAKKQLDALWMGELNQVLDELASHHNRKPVQDAIRYFRNNRQRMCYPLYREMGLQVGSGTIESGCKHVIAHRLKLAGMRWSKRRLQALAKLRTRLKSDRWLETLQLRPPPSRSLHPVPV